MRRCYSAMMNRRGSCSRLPGTIPPWQVACRTKIEAGKRLFVALIDGRLWFDSTVGQGSTFHS